jgi:predicted molibdopterin-dependent oxidoreductase YjgC
VLLAGIINAAASLRGQPPALPNLDLAHVADVTGVKPEAIAEAAQLLVEHSPAIIIYGSGVTHYSTATDVIKAIRSLAFTTGNAGIIGVPGEGNLVGAHDMGVHPALLPGYRPDSDAEARTSLGIAWNTKLDSTRGRNYEDILAGIGQGQVKALYLAGEVPPLPELAKLSFLVVQNIVPTEAAQYAHVILPATTFAEMDGTLTNLEGRVQRLRQAIQPVGQSRPGWMVVRDVAKRMGVDWNYESAADVMTEIAALVPAYAGVNYEMGMGGVLRRFEPAAQAQFVPFSLDGIPQPEGASAEFPLTLITERNLFYYYGACLTEEVKGMNLIKDEDILHLNPADAARLGIADGALVKVISPHGSAECIVRATNGLLEGTAFTSISRITGSPLFPTMVPRVKACGVRIEATPRVPASP